MPRANAAANKATVKKADQVMENQLEIPDFNKDEKDDLFIMYAFAIIITVLNFILLYKQVW